MAFDAAEFVLKRLGHEFFLEVFAGQTEGDVHEGTAVLIGMAAIETVGVIDGVIDDFCLALIALGHLSQTALRLDPGSDLAYHVDAEGRRRIVERVLLQEGVVAEHRRQGLRTLLEQGFFCHDEDNAGRSKVLLHAGVDEVKLLEINRTGQHIGGHISKERYAVCLRDIVVFRAIDGIVIAEMHIGSIRVDLELVL